MRAVQSNDVWPMARPALSTRIRLAEVQALVEFHQGHIDPKVAADNLRIFADDMNHSRPFTREEFESRPTYIKILDHLCGLFRSQL